MVRRPASAGGRFINCVPGLLAWSLMLSGAPCAAQTLGFPGIPRECPEDIDDTLSSALGALRLECAANAQIFGAHLQLDVRSIAALGVDPASQVRALVTRDEPARAAVYSGAMADAGSDGGMIWWGTWSAGAGSYYEGANLIDGASSVPMLFVGGIPAGITIREDALAARGAYGNGPIPVAGVANYRLLGGSKFYSSYNRNQGPWGLDADANPITPAAATAASLSLDFAARRGVLEITYNLRGAPARQRIELRQRRAPSTDFEAEECAAAADHCPTAELEFYGRQGEYAGVLVSVNTQTSMDEGARVATRLREVRSHAALVFRRQ